MKKNKIKTRISGRLKKIVSLSKKSASGFGQDDIHDFRVSVKKLRAFLRLLNTEWGDPPVLKIPKPLRKFYHRAGDVRNLQVQIETIKSLGRGKPIAGYLELLQQELEESKRQMDASLPSSTRLDYEEKKLDHDLPPKLNKKIISDFVLQKKGAILNILNEEKTDENLHELRKILKDLMYNEKWIEGIATLDTFPITSDLKTMTDLLGDHQDLFMHLHYLQPAYLDKLEEPEKKTLTAIGELLKKRKRILRRRILQKIGNRQ